MTGLGLEGDMEGTFPFEARYFEAPDVRLHYVDEGPRDAPAVLFVHGNPTWSYLWRRPIAELSKNGRRCIALDHMGFEVKNIDAYVAKLQAAGIKTDAAVRNSTNASGLRIAYITDPWGTEIELTEGLAATPAASR